MPLTDIHLHSHLEYELGTNRDINELYLFGSIGILVLLIACANYMNLATARTANRAREAGLRKVMGTHRLQLVQQFLGEAVVFAVFAFAAAVMLTEIFLPILNAVREQVTRDQLQRTFSSCVKRGCTGRRHAGRELSGILPFACQSHRDDEGPVKSYT